MSEPHVVGLSGSARSPSNTGVLVETMLDEVEAYGATTDHIDLAAYGLPVLNLERDTPAEVSEFTERVEQADALVAGTPMYHGSYSGVLKNAIDHCGFDEIEGTDVALAVVSGGRFPRVAVEHLRTVFSTLDARVFRSNVIVPNTSENFTADGAWNNENLEQRARRIAVELYEKTSR